MALQRADYDKHSRDAVLPGLLSAGSDFGAGTSPLTVTIPQPGPGWVVTPMVIVAKSEIIPSRGIGGINPVQTQDELLALDDRYIMIERFDAQGATNSVMTVMDRISDLSKSYHVALNVSSLVDAFDLQDQGLRIVFNAKHENERQYGLINYRVIEAETRNFGSAV